MKSPIFKDTYESLIKRCFFLISAVLAYLFFREMKIHSISLRGFYSCSGILDWILWIHKLELIATASKLASWEEEDRLNQYLILTNHPPEKYTISLELGLKRVYQKW